MPTLRETEFYCVQCRCKCKCAPKHIEYNTDRRGRPRLIGEDKYGHLMYKYIKFADATKMKKKYH